MSLLPDCLVPQVYFAFDGRRWPILFTHQILLRCEGLTGVDMLAANLGNPSAGLLRALLFLALERAGADCTIDEIGALIRPRSLRVIRGTVLEAWAASMSEPEKGSGKKVEKLERKKYTWLDAWAEATSRDGLGLSEEQWLEMTPRQAGALNKLRMDQMQREEMLMGILASTVANFGYRPPERPLSAESFMIHKLPEVAEGPLTGEYIMNQMKRKK